MRYNIVLVLQYIVLVFPWMGSVVEGISSGAKLAACASMYPLHATSARISQPPFSIALTERTYSSGANITVSLKANNLPGFKGFLCQSRQHWDSYLTYGALSQHGAVNMTNKCHTNASLTQAEPSVKTSVQFIWTAPQTNVGPVLIVCTVIQDFLTFWVNVTSPVMTYVYGETTASTSTRARTTSTSPTRSTNPATSHNTLPNSSPKLANASSTSTPSTTSPSPPINSTISSSAEPSTFTNESSSSGTTNSTASVSSTSSPDNSSTPVPESTSNSATTVTESPRNCTDDVVCSSRGVSLNNYTFSVSVMTPVLYVLLQVRGLFQKSYYF